MRKIHNIIIALEDLYTVLYNNIHGERFQEADRLFREIKDELRNTAIVPLNIIKDNITLERKDNAQSSSLIDNTATFSISADMITQKALEEHMDEEYVIHLVKEELLQTIVYKLTENEED